MPHFRQVSLSEHCTLLLYQVACQGRGCSPPNNHHECASCRHPVTRSNALAASLVAGWSFPKQTDLIVAALSSACFRSLLGRESPVVATGRVWVAGVQEMRHFCRTW